MVFKAYTFFSYVFLATAIIFLAVPARGAGLCDNSPNKAVCFSIVNQRTDPREATVAFLHKLIDQTKVGKVVAKRQEQTYEITKCITDFDRCIDFAKDALGYLNRNDLVSLKETMPIILNNYMDCDGVHQDNNRTNPIAKTTKLLEDIVSVGQYLVDLVKK